MDLIILDEVGYLTLGKAASDHLFQLVSKAYENVSLVVTSNLDSVNGARCLPAPALQLPYSTAFCITLTLFLCVETATGCVAAWCPQD
jgi:hypothetical protein